MAYKRRDSNLAWHFKGCPSCVRISVLVRAVGLLGRGGGEGEGIIRSFGEGFEEHGHVVTRIEVVSLAPRGDRLRRDLSVDVRLTRRAPPRLGEDASFGCCGNQGPNIRPVCIINAGRMDRIFDFAC